MADDGYNTLSFTETFLETLISKAFTASERRRIVRHSDARHYPDAAFTLANLELRSTIAYMIRRRVGSDVIAAKHAECLCMGRERSVGEVDARAPVGG
ncbi:MAG: hypothetical protein ACRDK2_04280 [Solirubrobacteraceae bacterium]